MKYCLINNLYPPLSIGGAENIVKIIATYLSKHDEVLVITTSSNGDTEYKEIPNLKIIRLPSHNLYHYLNNREKNILSKFIWHIIDVFNFRTAHEVKNILKRAKPDLVMTHNLKGLSYQIPRVIRKLKLKHIHTLHDYQLLDPHGSLHRKGINFKELPLRLKVYKYICLRLFKNIKYVISPSKFVLDKHLENGFFKKSKTYVMPNPIALTNSELLKKNSEKIRLLYLGQIEEHKGIRFLLESFKKYNSSNFELLIVGDGSKLQELKEQYTSNQIKFLGRVEHGEINNLFKNIDLTVVPSIWYDNSPTVIYESFANYIPVLVSNLGGSQELVKEGKTGFIYKYNEYSDLSSNLDKIAQNRADLAKYGANGYEFIKQFEVSKYIEKLKRI